MVALLTKLSYKLYISSVRGGWATVGLVLRLLYLVAMLALFFGIVLVAHTYTPGIAPNVVIGFGLYFALFMVGASVLFPDSDYLLPEKFALFPVPGNKLAVASVTASAALPSGIATVLLGAIAIIAYLDKPLALAAAVIAIPLFLLQSILLDKVVAGLLARLFANKNLRTTVSVVLLIVVYIGFIALHNIFGGAGGAHGTAVKIPAEIIENTLNIASFTPFISALGAPYHFYAGNTVLGVICLLETIVLLVVMWVLHHRQITARLTDPVSYKGDAKVRGVSVIDRMLPATALGAIAARRLKYTFRDPRYIMTAFSIVILPIVMIVFSARNLHDKAPFMVLLSVISAGAMVQTDIAYDHRAFAFHILHNVSGKNDRLGRSLAILPLILVPPLVIAPVVGLLFNGMHNVVPAILLLIPLSLTGLGIGNFVGVFMPGAAPKPGANPLTNRKKGAGMQAVAGAYIMLFGMPILQLPMIILAIWGLANDLPVLFYAGVAIGFVLAVVYFVAGISLGAKKLESRWDKVYAAVTKDS